MFGAVSSVIILSRHWTKRLRSYTWRVDQRDLGGDDQRYSYLAEVHYNINTEHFWVYRWYEGYYVSSRDAGVTQTEVIDWCMW